MQKLTEILHYIVFFTRETKIFSDKFRCVLNLIFSYKFYLFILWFLSDACLGLSVYFPSKCILSTKFTLIAQSAFSPAYLSWPIHRFFHKIYLGLSPGVIFTLQRSEPLLDLVRAQKINNRYMIIQIIGIFLLKDHAANPGENLEKIHWISKAKKPTNRGQAFKIKNSPTPQNSLFDFLASYFSSCLFNWLIILLRD